MHVQAVDQRYEKFFSRVRSLTRASEKRQIELASGFDWETKPTGKIWLRQEKLLSIYGTPYFELATGDEKYELSKQELGTWWMGFVHLERLVVEFYIKLINNGHFADMPAIHEYMHHFIREEINHTLMFVKAMEYYEIDPFPCPDFLKDLYCDYGLPGKNPLMAIYLTLIIEWIADAYTRIDTNDPSVHPLARKVVSEHGREEARHIVWAQDMILELAETDPKFLKEAREITPFYLNQLLLQGVTNQDAIKRVNFKHEAFQDLDRLLTTVIYNDYRDAVHREMARPVIRYLVKAGIYHKDYHDVWAQYGFDRMIREAQQSFQPTLVVKG